MKKETVICPFCGYEMLTGKIKTGQLIMFSYEAGSSVNQNHTPERDYLEFGSLWNGTNLDTYVCKRCNKLIVDAEPRESKFNIKKILGCEE